MERRSGAEVFGDTNIMGEILVRTGTTGDVVRSSAVHPAWRQAARAPGFFELMAQHRAPSVIGFLVEFDGVLGPAMELFNAEVAPSDRTVAALAARIDRTSLEIDRVVGSRGGFVLTENGISMNQGGYSVSCLSHVPKLYTFAAPPIPPIERLPGQHTNNNSGQFGILPDAGPAGIAFFSSELDAPPMFTYEGMSFSSEEAVHVHVSTYNDLQWIHHHSPPIAHNGIAFFHSHPYSILTEHHLFMIYIVGTIVCFDRSTRAFTDIAMPNLFNTEARSDMDYAVGRHGSDGISLVLLHNGILHTWFIKPVNGVSEWQFASSVDLMALFVNNFGMEIWGHFLPGLFGHGGDIEFQSIQIRAVSVNGGFVLLTVGFDQGVYVLDTVRGRLTEVNPIDPDASIGPVFTLTEPWPPVF